MFQGKAPVFGKGCVKNADKKQLKFSSEFIKNDKFSWYANLGYMEDEFAGYEEQYKLGLGMINYFIKGEETVFSCSLGLDFTKEEYTDNTEDDETWLRLGLDGKRKVADNIRPKSHTILFLACLNGLVLK